MEQKGIGDRLQLKMGFVVVNALGIAGPVAAGQHNGPIYRAHQEMVQGRVGQHHPRLRHVRSHRRGQIMGIADREQHDRGSPPQEERSLVITDYAKLPHGLQIAGHHRQRLVGAMFAGPQPLHHGFLGGIAG